MENEVWAGRKVKQSRKKNLLKAFFKFNVVPFLFVIMWGENKYYAQILI